MMVSSARGQDLKSGQGILLEMLQRFGDLDLQEVVQLLSLAASCLRNDSIDAAALIELGISWQEWQSAFETGH